MQEITNQNTDRAVKNFTQAIPRHVLNQALTAEVANPVGVKDDRNYAHAQTGIGTRNSRIAEIR